MNEERINRVIIDFARYFAEKTGKEITETSYSEDESVWESWVFNVKDKTITFREAMNLHKLYHEPKHSEEWVRRMMHEVVQKVVADFIVHRIDFQKQNSGFYKYSWNRAFESRGNLVDYNFDMEESIIQYARNIREWLERTEIMINKEGESHEE